MSKLLLQFKALEKVNNRLEEAASLPVNSINQDATIQRFEFTFELAWKLMQSILKDNGLEVYGVKSIIREAEKLQLIKELKIWFEFLNNRNLSSHTYNEEIAGKVYNKAKEFVMTAKELLSASAKHLK